MALVEWNKTLSIGIKSVDDQHKVLVKLLNNLNDALDQGRADIALKQIFDELAIYTEKHFSYEEALFKKYGYPNQKAHIQEHQELIIQVQNLKEKMLAGEFMINIEVMNFLKDWLTEHILKTDKAFAPFLIDKGVT